MKDVGRKEVKGTLHKIDGTTELITFEEDFVQIGLGELMSIYIKHKTTPFWKKSLKSEFVIEDIEKTLNEIKFEIPKIRTHWFK